MKRVLVFAITLLTASSLFAQVHIKENAVITPGQVKKVQETHTIHLDIIVYDDPNHSESCRLKVLKSCEDTVTYYASSVDPRVGSTFKEDIDVTTAGAYGYILEIYKVDPHSVDACADVYWDGSLKYEDCGATSEYDTDSSQINTWRSVSWTGFIETPYSSGFSLSLYPSPSWMPPTGDSTIRPYVPGVYYGQTIGITGGNIYNCSTTAWYPYYPIILSIISGGQYASFHSFDPNTGGDVKLGSIVYVSEADNVLNVDPYFSGGDYYLVADSVQPDSVGEWVVVQAESNGLTSIDSMEIFPPPVAVTFDPPEVLPGDTANIVVKQRNPDGTLTDFPSGELFEVQIDSGNGYGTILSAGDTASYFASIPQPFQFIAADSIAGDSVVVGVQVGQMVAIPSSIVPGGKGPGTKGAILKNKSISANIKSPLIKSPMAMSSNEGRKKVSFVQGDYGIGYVKIEKPILKIVNHAPWSIWPDLPQGTITAKETNPPGYNHKRGFTISVTEAEGNPVPNAAVEIRHDYQQGTGGHAHGASNDLIPLQSLQGTFYGQGHTSGPDGSLQLTTDVNGTAIVDSLVASQISGTYLIAAYLVSDPTVKDTVNLAVQVTGLVPLAGSQNLITYTSDAKDHTLSNSDYGTPTVNAAIVDAVKSYADDYGMDNDIFLAVIDMSLPWGGLFDINGDWITPHSLHRVGNSVDFSKWYRDASGNVISVDIYVDGKLWMSTNLIDQVTLDGYFELKGFDRKEANIGKIHYESNN